MQSTFCISLVQILVLLLLATEGCLIQFEWSWFWIYTVELWWTAVKLWACSEYGKQKLITQPCKNTPTMNIMKFDIHYALWARVLEKLTGYNKMFSVSTHSQETILASSLNLNMWCPSHCARNSSNEELSNCSLSSKTVCFPCLM